MTGAVPRTADVVVIGGGVMGASCAYHLLRAGVRQVVLLEREDAFGTGATGRCAGGVRHQFATEINVRLSLASLPRFDSFREETGQDCDYRKCGYLIVLTKPADVESFRHSVALQNRLGVPTEWVTADEVRARLPEMHWPDALAGTFNAQDGLVDPNSVVMGYVQRARQLGLTALTESPASAIEVDHGRVAAVVTPGGRLTCGAVVDAAGPWAAVVGQMAGVDIPITPVRRQMVTTTPLPKLRREFPFVIDFAQSLYFHREGDGILTGMSNPNERPGFDQSIDREWEIRALEAAATRLPMLDGAGRLSGWAGLYEVTPDAHPIFGATPVEGFTVVAGFSGHGFMHGPIAGQLMAELITQGRFVTVDVSSLDLARFAEGRLIREYNVV
jgi:sarcosine oxidase, subunit beta